MLALAFLVIYFSFRDIDIIYPGQSTDLAIVTRTKPKHVVEVVLICIPFTPCQLIARSKPGEDVFLIMRYLILLRLKTLKSEIELAIPLLLQFSLSL